MSARIEWVRRLVVAMGAVAALATVAGCGDDEPPTPADPTFEPTLKMTATEAP
ncbi:hypothetical protein [Actinophytocola sediminis]